MSRWKGCKTWCEKIIKVLTAPSNLQKTPFAFEQEGVWFQYVIPSFWRLLDRLKDDGRDFAVVLRTFGTDGPAIADAINAFAQGKHPEYPNGCAAALLASPSSGSLKRSDGGIRLELLGTKDSPARTIENEAQIYKFFT